MAAKFLNRAGKSILFLVYGSDIAIDEAIKCVASDKILNRK